MPTLFTIPVTRTKTIDHNLFSDYASKVMKYTKIYVELETENNISPLRTDINGGATRASKRETGPICRTALSYLVVLHGKAHT